MLHHYVGIHASRLFCLCQNRSFLISGMEKWKGNSAETNKYIIFAINKN